MNSVQSVEPGVFNTQLAQALKERKAEFEAPEWAALVKTGTHTMRPTANPDFWHARAASILRQIYLQETVGVQRLRTRYGGKKNRGGKPSKFKRGGGKIIRIILQQAETAGLVQKAPEGQKAGRQLTPEGKEFLENVAGAKQ